MSYVKIGRPNESDCKCKKHPEKSDRVPSYRQNLETAQLTEL